MSARTLPLAVAFLFTVFPAIADTKPAATATSKITIVGKLQKAAESVCQLVREDKTNKIFSFTPKSKYKNGTHVKITAHGVEVSPCQQGTPIAIEKIVKIK